MSQIKRLILIGLTITPSFVFAAADFNFKTVIENIISFVLDPLVYLLIAVAVVIILWGVVKYIGSGGDEGKRKEGRDFIVYGLIGLFVMVSIWGLVTVLINTFGITEQAPPAIVPKLPEQ